MEDDAGPAPVAVATESLSSLIPLDAQGDEWLPLCCRTGELEMAPIGDVTTEARRIRALVSRDCNRHSRGAGPYWNDNTFKLAARIHCNPESTIGQRGHRLRQVDRRNWSVGSNRIKRLIPDTTAWREEGHCKLCKVSMDSYDHLYTENALERTSVVPAPLARRRSRRSGRSSHLAKEPWRKYSWSSMKNRTAT